MEIEVGDFKITAPYEKYFLKHIMKNPFDIMFSKYNQDLLYTFFKRAPLDYTNFFEEYKNFMEKLIKMSKTGKGEEQVQ